MLVGREPESSTSKDSDRDFLSEPCSIVGAIFRRAKELLKRWEDSFLSLVDNECFLVIGPGHLVVVGCLLEVDSIFSVFNTSTCHSQEKKKVTTQKFDEK